jgi:hypothetical protein
MSFQPRSAQNQKVSYELAVSVARVTTRTFRPKWQSEFLHRRNPNLDIFRSPAAVNLTRD